MLIEQNIGNYCTKENKFLVMKSNSVCAYAHVSVYWENVLNITIVM